MNSEEIRTEKYRKNASQEAALKELNSLLRELPVSISVADRPPRWPICFLVGAPRSGSTLLSQYLASSGCFGYISNFVARFWENPVLGRMIEKLAVDPLFITTPIFSSTFGVTPGLKGCHEFGYFWERWFAFSNRETHKLTEEELATVDADGLRKEVFRLANTFKRPLFFKNLTSSFQIAFLAKVFPQAHFVVCERDPRYQCQSILIARKELLGNKKYWWSLRPPEFKTLQLQDPFSQVAGQVYYTLAAINEGLAGVPLDRVVRIRYDRFCKAPKEVLSELCSSLCLADRKKNIPPEPPAYFTADDRIKTDASTWEKIETACHDFFQAL